MLLFLHEKLRNIYKVFCYGIFMDKRRVLIIGLLVIAIAFSLMSIIMSVSLGDFERISPRANVPAGGSAGSVGMTIEAPTGGGETG
jgi:hypothetical protein